MTPSEKCIAFIKSHEGLILHPYLDSAGVPTIGFGSTMYKNGKKVTMADPAISLVTALDLLHWEVDNKAKSVNSFLSNVVLNQNQFDALVSFAYNEGVGALQGSTLLKKIKVNPTDPTIRNEFMKWIKIHEKGILVSSDGLIHRRKEEADLYFSK